MTDNKNNKDPAFLFYSSDFLTGVSDLTMEERGQFITLLCLQHQKGRLSKKSIQISVGIAAADERHDVLNKFEVDDDGLYFNRRLEEEVEKRQRFSDKQRDRARKGWEKRRKNNDATAHATALPEEDENDNTLNNIDVLFSKFSNAYPKAAHTQACQQAFFDLPSDERSKAIAFIPNYLNSVEEEKYISKGCNYLKSLCWKDGVKKSSKKKVKSVKMVNGEIVKSNG